MTPAEQLYTLGYTPLVSVIPPSAALSPGSTITTSQLGKTPGRKLANGTWAGYGWLKHETTLNDVKQWAQDGANLGLLAATFPAVDIDCMDVALAREIGLLAQRILGPAPVRTGQAPKSLLAYRLTGDPFARMALLVYPEGKSPDPNVRAPCHLIEVLGAGRQYLIHGTHPSGSPYVWDRPLPPADELTALSKEQVEHFFTEVADLLELLPGCVVERIGDGALRAATGPQAGLVAPSLEALTEAVRLIPNDGEVVREQYIKIGYAIRAAWPEDEEDAYTIFARWAGSHTGSERVTGNPETWRADFRRMRPPYSVGYGWLAEIARRWGYSDAQLDFEALDEAREAKAEEESGSARLSDQWCAHRVIAEQGSLLRFVAAEERWYVWSGGRWVPDAVNLAQHMVDGTLGRLSAWMARQGSTPAEQKEALTQARRLASAYARDSVLKIVQADPRVVIRPEAFDADPWALNTPAGVLDLTTGMMHAHTADTLCSKMTRIAPDDTMACPEWLRFLDEATLHDVDLMTYLQRLSGYCLTGVVTEQVFAMIWGPGGNGKSVFLNTLAHILGTYARTSPMDTFTASGNDRHPTELAMLMGARMVSANETQAGRRWDEARVKGLTGGDAVTARFMRQDFFTFLPTFKLIFVGNHKPELQVVDRAMQRRIHVVPFVVNPLRVDPELSAKLRGEAPAILAWAVRGCLRWQREGLAAPAVVTAATQDYFTEQDAIGRWLEESTREAPNHFHTSEELFESWREWAGRNGEYTGKMRAFVQRVAARKIPRSKDAKTRRHGFEGLSIMNLHHFETEN